MHNHLLIAVIGGLINMLLSAVVPCLIKKSDVKDSFLLDVKKVFDSNRQVIITSSIIVGITIFLALKLADEISPHFGNLAGLASLGDMSNNSGLSGVSVMSAEDLPPKLRNLLRL